MSYCGKVLIYYIYENRSSNDSPKSIIYDGHFTADPISIANVFFSTVPTKILKILQVLISKHLTDIFNLSFSTSIFPNSLKSVKVVPIHKKNSKLVVSNYRPISCLSNSDKLLRNLFIVKSFSFLKIKK